MIIPAEIGLLVTPAYLLTSDPTWIVVGFLSQAVFAGTMYSQMLSYRTARFPIEVRATAAAFHRSRRPDRRGVARMFGSRGRACGLVRSPRGQGVDAQQAPHRHGHRGVIPVPLCAARPQ
jgi:hypothetical protein